MSLAIPWSTTSTIRASVRDVSRRIVLALVILGVLPTVAIHGPRMLLDVPSQLRPLVDGGSTLVWAALLPIQVHFALGLARRSQRAFCVRVIRRIPATLVPVLAGVGFVSAARWLTQGSGVPGSSKALLGAMLMFLTTYLSCRTFTWVFLVVDRGLAPWPALKLGVAQTRGHVLRIAVLMFLLGGPPVLLSLMLPRPLNLLVWICAMPITLVSCARVYSHLSTSRGAGAVQPAGTAREGGSLGVR
jgi:hypothetical protein